MPGFIACQSSVDMKEIANAVSKLLNLAWHVLPKLQSVARWCLHQEQPLHFAACPTFDSMMLVLSFFLSLSLTRALSLSLSRSSSFFVWLTGCLNQKPLFQN